MGCGGRGKPRKAQVRHATWRRSLSARGGQAAVPCALDSGPAVLERDRAGKRVGLAAHMRGALYVVLTAERVDTAAGLPEVAGEERQIDEQRDAISALDVLGDAEAVHDHRGRPRRIETRRTSNETGIDAADLRGVLGRPGRQAVRERLEAVDFRVNERSIDEAVGDDHLRHGAQKRWQNQYLKFLPVNHVGSFGDHLGSGVAVASSTRRCTATRSMVHRLPLGTNTG